MTHLSGKGIVLPNFPIMTTSGIVPPMSSLGNNIHADYFDIRYFIPIIAGSNFVPHVERLTIIRLWLLFRYPLLDFFPEIFQTQSFCPI